MSKSTIIIISLLVVAILAGAGYWFYYMKSGTQAAVTVQSGVQSSSGTGGSIFSPLDGNSTPSNSAAQNIPTGTTTSQISTSTSSAPIPLLRELSSTPLGGMAASSTGTSSIVRWIDRGTGHIYEANSNSLAISEISNTTVPMIYESFWNENLNAFIFQSIADGSDAVTNFYAVLSPAETQTPATSTTQTSINTPFELRGAALPSNTSEIAVSPEGNQVFTLDLVNSSSASNNSANNSELASESSAGYISQFDGSKRTEIFSTPLTQFNVEWPTDATIALTTKSQATTPGFLYFVNPKTGVFNKILGDLNGLDTLTNSDASQVLYSVSNNNSFITSIYNVKTGANQEIAFNTLPEKCVWGTTNKNQLICAVPSRIPTAQYPDAWYQGMVSFSDSIWEEDVSTGEVHEIADLLNVSGQIIDAENLTLDPKENTLYFINKRDLSLWSLNLNS